jgi:radical SAM superfamily enzyme YgiQ (UPF0313 family)
MAGCGPRRLPYNAGVRVLLVATYELGRQPFGLASPAASLRRAGVEVSCVDTSRDSLADAALAAADLIAVHLPMHTATRLAAPLLARARMANPDAILVAYGLYAPLNAEWLRARGVSHVLGPEAEPGLVALAMGEGRIAATAPATALPRVVFVRPDRRGLPAPERYAALQMPDGRRRVAGSTEATRGCRHLCRHCPIVPVYEGRFRAVPVDVVLDDIRAQVEAGVEHISFGDPDFLNGPTHARRIVERLAAECPGLTYDVTIKIEHLLAHRPLLPVLRDTGCLFVTSAVESFDDDVLERLRKGHTRADVARAVAYCREAGLALSPTFVPFTPWTTIGSYLDLLEQIETLELVPAVAPVQLSIRLLVPAGSALLELPEVRAGVAPFDAEALVWPWRHHDPRVDALQLAIAALVVAGAHLPREVAFEQVAERAHEAAGRTRPPKATRCASAPPVPFLTEPWYCCAEPVAGH